jgi:alpha,alpha-trehalase
VLPSNVTSGPLPAPASGQSTFSLVPSGQIGLTENQLPGQLVRVEDGQDRNASSSGPAADLNKLNGTVVNGGNATLGEGWAKALERQLANRYLSSAFCSWYVPTPGDLSKNDDLRLMQACDRRFGSGGATETV